MDIILRRRNLGRRSCFGIAAKAEEPLSVILNDSLINEPVEYCFRWGCTSVVSADVNVNESRSIQWCSDKRQGRLDLQAAGVPVPKTWALEDFRTLIPHTAGVPYGVQVVRPARHAQGRDLLLAGWSDIAQGNYHPKYEGGYVSALIDKVAEYRVFVCQNRVVWVARKTPGNPEDVAWNVARGGRFDNVSWGDWPLQVIAAALQAAKVSGTDFSGVDVMVDAEGNPYVLEVNSAPSQTSEYRQTCVAKAFTFIVRNGKAHFPDPESIQSWKNVIHPALWPRA